MATFLKGSRFKNGSIYQFERNIQTIFPIDINYNLVDSIGTVTITAGMAHRPDLVSLRAYRRSDLGWHIMDFNLLDSPDQLTAGLTLSIPSLEGII